MTNASTLGDMSPEPLKVVEPRVAVQIWDT
jgi:hypothetical protein